ncbi:carboxypeptidase-like regulatory domain-containing protein [Granulicella sibirica]|nr:carboxypeptidase-like regulatory domain-containing protein [Granulicella sibirica]
MRLFAVLAGLGVSLRETPSSTLRKRVCCGGLLAGILLGGVSETTVAQVNETLTVGELDFPDAPGIGGQAETHGASAQTGSASIAGTVVDMSGVAIQGARVTVLREGAADEQVMLSNEKGEFVFEHLPAGSFRVAVRSKGMETFASNDIVLPAGRRFELPLIELPFAPTNTEVQVVVTEEAIAQEQMKAEEKQRILGILPNFYTSYIWNAAPLRPKQKFELSLKSVTDPVAIAAVAVSAGIEQANNTFPGYGQGAEGYAKRFGAGYADRTIGRLLSSAVFPSIFRQDPRYFYRGTGSIKSRALYAIGSALICKGDNGELQPNYSHVLGNFAAAGISNLYRAQEDRTASLTIRNGFILTAGNAATNLIREFISRKISSNVPSYAQGKPLE